MRKILGIDPGIATTGFGVIQSDKQKLKLIDYGCIKTKTGLPHATRLKQISEELTKIIKKYKPNMTAVEKLFFCNNVKTALTVGEARGVVMLTICQNNLPIYEYTPLQVKQAVSAYGKASKIQVQKMVKLLLNMDKMPKPDDAADALAVAICCANSTLTPLPAVATALQAGNLLSPPDTLRVRRRAGRGARGL